MRNEIARRSTSLALAATLFLGVPTVALADEPASPAPASSSTGVAPTATAPSNKEVDAPESAGVAPAEAAPPNGGVAPSWPVDRPRPRRFVAMAPPTDGWGESELTVPPTRRSTFKMGGPTLGGRRDKAMAAAGGITMGVGLLTGLAGMYAGMANLDCEMILIFPGCKAHDQGVATASEAMMIGGLVTLVFGIPILVIGLKKRPAPSTLTSFAGEPAPSGWAWRF